MFEQGSFSATGQGHKEINVDVNLKKLAQWIRRSNMNTVSHMNYSDYYFLQPEKENKQNKLDNRVHSAIDH